MINLCHMSEDLHCVHIFLLRPIIKGLESSKARKCVGFPRKPKEEKSWKVFLMLTLISKGWIERQHKMWPLAKVKMDVCCRFFLFWGNKKCLWAYILLLPSLVFFFYQFFCKFCWPQFTFGFCPMSFPENSSLSRVSNSKGRTPPCCPLERRTLAYIFR